MSEMITDRQTSKKEERHDLFTSLLDANNEDNDDAKLTNSELIGELSGACELGSGRELIPFVRQHFHFPHCWT